MLIQKKRTSRRKGRSPWDGRQYFYGGVYKELADWMLAQHDAGVSYAEIGRQMVGRKTFRWNAPITEVVSGTVVSSVIKLKLRERAEGAAISESAQRRSVDKPHNEQHD